MLIKEVINLLQKEDPEASFTFEGSYYVYSTFYFKYRGEYSNGKKYVTFTQSDPRDEPE